MKRVFLLAGNPLFHRGIQTLLARRCDVELVGAETDVERAIARIRELEPDVVILEDGSHEGHSIITRILATGAKIVSLNFRENSISIYHGEQRTVHAVDDLFDAIENVEGEKGVMERSMTQPEN
ncbi:hypothetical protein ANRL1_02483 [Anaerolineae bacterium]|nr:hypothetical protein ANRL1_02483 [Anaerolineae bacterium]